MKMEDLYASAVSASGLGAASSDTRLLCSGDTCGHRQCQLFDVALCAAFGRLLVQSSDRI